MLEERLRAVVKAIKWPLIVSLNAMFLIGFLAMIMRSPEPDPVEGHTFLLYILTKGGWLSVYTQPWIGQTFIWLFCITMAFLVIYVPATAYLLVKLKDKGDVPPSSTS